MIRNNKDQLSFHIGTSFAFFGQFGVCIYGSCAASAADSTHARRAEPLQSPHQTQVQEPATQERVQFSRPNDDPDRIREPSRSTTILKSSTIIVIVECRTNLKQVGWPASTEDPRHRASSRQLLRPRYRCTVVGFPRPAAAGQRIGEAARRALAASRLLAEAPTGGQLLHCLH